MDHRLDPVEVARCDLADIAHDLAVGGPIGTTVAEVADVEPGDAMSARLGHPSQHGADEALVSRDQKVQGLSAPIHKAALPARRIAYRPSLCAARTVA